MDRLTLTAADGKTIPVQSWPLAYWPDGSLKWTGQAIATPAQLTGPLQVAIAAPVAPADAAAPQAIIKCLWDDAKIDFDTGAMRCRILRQGSTLFESIFIGDREVAKDAKLIGIVQDRSQYEKEGIIREEPLVSRISAVTLEQSGPLRAVVKVEGTHVSTRSQRSWLPFTVRLYFFAGLDSVRIVHSFVWDGDNSKDYLRGLGLSFTVPFKEELHNRHVRFGGDEGMWVQPVRMLPGYRSLPANPAEYSAYLGGKRMPNLADYTPQQQTAIQSVPVWNNFKLTQLGPGSYSIDKQTTDKSSWLHVNNGHRAPGFAVLADVSGGIAVAAKNFWQKYPASIEISNAASEAGEMKIWLWSPDAQPMDMRRYDTWDHGLTTNYEDLRRPDLGTPYGIAHSADLTLWAFSAIPSNAQLVKMSQTAQQPAMLVCTPQYYHDVAAFGGMWSLPDRSTPAKRWVEDQISQLFDYYHGQVDERSWYGFWDYGDIMHNYDFGRHEWRYDIGGWAWMNTELMPNIYLWYSFLRTGRADIYHMAEDMDRQTAEGDVYHIGPLAPLGTRHNVNHWGDGAKQPRMSHAGLKRFSYYLTTDERTGDLLHEVVNADHAWALLNTGDADKPVRVAFGTDWTAMAINWMTEWERTGDLKSYNKLLAGMTSLVQMAPPGQLGAGGMLDPQTGIISTGGGPGGGGRGARGGTTRAGTTRAGAATAAVGRGAFRGGPSYFDMIFGGPESLFEMRSMIDYPQFWDGWANYCQQAGPNTTGNQMTAPRLLAYAAYAKNDAAAGREAWNRLIADGMNPAQDTPIAKPKDITGPDVPAPVQDPVFLGKSVGWQLHGPASIQWALNAIETMQLAGDYAPPPEKPKPTTAP
jgi:hypothetical protein